jgi:hypothetical protein
MVMTLRAVLLVVALAVASAFAPPRATPALLVPARARGMAPLPVAAPAASRRPAAAVRRAGSPVRMGLFGLGWPEIGVISIIALFFFGPEKLAPLAKELGACGRWNHACGLDSRAVRVCRAGLVLRACLLAGKSSSGLKEVAESFQQGMAEGETGVSTDGGDKVVKSAEPEKKPQDV